jgi:ribosomal protein S18 acetylase RimI-like enzyme
VLLRWIAITTTTKYDNLQTAKFSLANHPFDSQLGCICATVDEHDSSTVVIATLAVYGAHRRRGVGRRLVQHVQEHAPASCSRLIVHVQTGNDDAAAFYTRLGFVRRETLANYYSKMTPSSCDVYEKLHTAAET